MPEAVLVEQLKPRLAPYRLAGKNEPRTDPATTKEIIHKLLPKNNNQSKLTR